VLIWVVILVLTVGYGLYLVAKFVVSNLRAVVAALALAVIAAVILAVVLGF